MGQSRKVMNPHWKKSLSQKTHQQRFLWQTSLSIFVTGFLLAFFLQFSTSSFETPAQLSRFAFNENSEIDFLLSQLSDHRNYEELLNDPKIEFHKKLRQAFFFSHEINKNKSLKEQFQNRVLTQHEALVLSALVASYQMANDGALSLTKPPIETLALDRTLTKEAYVQFALGEYYLNTDRFKKAIDAFHKEAANVPESDYARKRIVDLYEAYNNVEALSKLEKQEAFKPFITASAHLEIAIKDRDVPSLAKWIVPAELQYMTIGSLLMASLGGILWLTFLSQAFQINPLQNVKRFGLVLAAIACGIVGTFLTIFVVILQEEFFNLREQSELGPGLLYFVAGVGLREELIKLLCFVPMLPFLLRIRDPLFALLIASCVGLGFATQENIGYFMGDFGLGVSARYITANFLHISLTGLCGFALYLAFINWNNLTLLANNLGMAIIAHGLYDAFLSLPTLTEYGIFALSILVLIGYQYFRYMHTYRANMKVWFSLTANFCFGLALLISISLVYLSAMMGLPTAFKLLGHDFLSYGLLIILFVREIKEPIR